MCHHRTVSIGWEWAAKRFGHYQDSISRQLMMIQNLRKRLNRCVFLTRQNQFLLDSLLCYNKSINVMLVSLIRAHWRMQSQKHRLPFSQPCTMLAILCDILIVSKFILVSVRYGHVTNSENPYFLQCRSVWRVCVCANLRNLCTCYTRASRKFCKTLRQLCVSLAWNSDCAPWLPLIIVSCVLVPAGNNFDYCIMVALNIWNLLFHIHLDSKHHVIDHSNCIVSFI